MNDKYPEVQALYKSKKMTNIAYADWTVNLQKWWCTHAGRDCLNCYMLAMAKMYPANAADGPVWRENGVSEFMKMPPGAVVFLGDMYDVYHEQTPFEHIRRTHDLIASRPDVTVLLLTKRPHIAWDYRDDLLWPNNLWFGVTMGYRAAIPRRMQYLKASPAQHKWVSCEPLIESLVPTMTCELLSGIDWVVCGAESGNTRRAFSKNWARLLMSECKVAGVPFFYKQSSGKLPGTDPYLEGEKYFNFPPQFMPLKHEMATAQFVPEIVQLSMFDNIEGGE